MRQGLWKTLTCSLAYLGVAAACLAQWNGADRELRVDWFAGSYFALRLMGRCIPLFPVLVPFVPGRCARNGGRQILIPRDHHG
jgi:hypothetical protein